MLEWIPCYIFDTADSDANGVVIEVLSRGISHQALPGCNVAWIKNSSRARIDAHLTVWHTDVYNYLGGGKQLHEAEHFHNSFSGQKARVKLSVLLYAHANREQSLEHFKYRKEGIDMVGKIGRVVRQYEGKPIIYGIPLSEELTAWFEAKRKKFRAGHSWDWLYRKTCNQFLKKLTNLPKSLIGYKKSLHLEC